MQDTDVNIAAPLRIPKPPLNRRSMREWWHAESGYREVFSLAWPLFLAQGSSTVLQFVDRMFLTWYSSTGLAAAGPSGMLAFAIQALFIGMTGYAATFVAQYTGAGKPRQAVAVVWQALYLSVVFAILIIAIAPIGNMAFKVAGHAQDVQRLERVFYGIFMHFALISVAFAAVSGYFIGKGQTGIILRINILTVITNIVLDYFLIFGRCGFPELGMAGAAYSSVIAQGLGLTVGFIVFLRESSEEHATGAWRFDLILTKRLLRYASPSGLHFALDMLGWTVFLMLVGRLGVAPLGATNLAFQLNTLAFFPIIGFAMATSTLVGQNLGKNRPDLADRAVWSAIHLSVVFTGAVGIIYVLAPHLLLAPFAAQADPHTFEPVRRMTIVILRFVAAYCVFDVGNLIFSGALKGAGDTFFVMLLTTGGQVILMLIPTMLWCIATGGLGVYGAWAFLTLTVCSLMVTFLLRYLRGHWRNMRVIEHEVI